jgi:hypothetical protein
VGERGQGEDENGETEDDGEPILVDESDGFGRAVGMRILGVRILGVNVSYVSVRHADPLAGSKVALQRVA